MTLEEKLIKLKALKTQVLAKAKERNTYHKRHYFGYDRDVIDEAEFPNEIQEMNALLDGVKYSDTLHEKFNQARGRLVDEILYGEQLIIRRIDDFADLSEQHRVRLAQDISKRFHEIFLGRDYKYRLPIITYDPESDRSIHRSYALKERWQWRPKQGKIIFSKNVICNPNNKVSFLNLVFHEACVHAPMYQLLQGYKYGRIKPTDPLYHDAKLAHGCKNIGLSAPFQIASIYPNFIEEALAFKQAVHFVDDLGFDTTNMEDKVILASADCHRPYSLA